MSKTYYSVLFALVAMLICAKISDASAQSCDEIAASIATTPVSSQTPTGVKSALDKINKIPANADIALIGDSLIEQWAENKDVAFSGMAAWNYGVGGDRTQNVLWSDLLPVPGPPGRPSSSFDRRRRAMCR